MFKKNQKPPWKTMVDMECRNSTNRIRSLPYKCSKINSVPHKRGLHAWYVPAIKLNLCVIYNMINWCIMGSKFKSLKHHSKYQCVLGHSWIVLASWTKKQVEEVGIKNIWWVLMPQRWKDKVLLFYQLIICVLSMFIYWNLISVW
jgi:hypothetical protein